MRRSRIAGHAVDSGEPAFRCTSARKFMVSISRKNSMRGKSRKFARRFLDGASCSFASSFDA